ncbi:MAG TPA: PAS domain S-box protein, partial [Chitinophagaceae bacterium]|nr:PAS domain S-box protein [Chitinophagaceae bacterium]
KDNDLARVRQRIAAVFDTGKSYEYEIAWSIPEGLKYYSIRLFPELDLKGSVINVLGIARDITERKDAEEELRRSEDNLRLVIDKIPVMVFTSLPDGSIDFVNQQWLQYMGLSLEDVKDWAWESTIHPEDRQKSIDHWRSTMATGQPSENELRVRRADGVYRWILGRFVPLHDESGKIIKWYGVSIDIEDSKQAQDALRESEQQYLSLFENMAEGVAYFQMLFKDGKLQDAIYLEVNPAWINLTGLKNVIGRKITEVFPGILEANSEFFERSVRVALTGQSERFEIYSTLLKKWLSVSAYCPKKDHVIVVFDDISKRKLAEETLQQSYEAIRQLTEHLQKIREEERTSIAREIHDELGQQLTAVKMDVAWIDKKIPEETRDIKRKLKNIIELLDGSNQSIRRILSELRPRILDDHGLLEAIEWLGRQFTETTGIPVKCTTPEKDIKVSEQIATCLFRVCQEAFTNITRYAFAKNVSVSIRVIEENIILTIEDNGIGFDTTLIENKKSFGILGMKERVFSLGGKFELLSSPGKGAKITVSLPYKL